MITALSTLKDWFKTGKKPSENQFRDTLDSFWHKSEYIPQKVIANSPLDDFGLFLFTLEQSGDNPPEMKVLHSDFTYDPMWLYTYKDKGSYVIRSDNEASTWAGAAYYNASQPKDDNTTVRIKQYSDFGFQVMTYASGKSEDNQLDYSVLFEIRMQPGSYSDGKATESFSHLLP